MRHGRGVWRAAAALVGALASVVALQAPAMAASSLDGTQPGWLWGYPTQVPLETYTATLPTGWWSAIGIRGFYYDYDLALSTSAGTPLATSQLRGTQPDFVAVNNNTSDGCFVASQVTAQILPVNPVSTPPIGNPPSIADPQWTVNKSARSLLATDPATPSGLRYQTVYARGDRPVEIFDVWLSAGGRYRVGWNIGDPNYAGVLFLFAPDPSRCVVTPWDATLAINSGTAGPFSIEFTATRSGWYGLAITMENTFNTLSDRPTVLVKAVA